jgi:ferrous iron transport protein B
MQLLESGTPIIVALNMGDDAEKMGIYIDEKRLSRFLKTPVIKINAKKKKGIDQLQQAILNLLIKKSQTNPPLNYGKEVDKVLEELISIAKTINIPSKYNKKFLALKLLERDPEVITNISRTQNTEKLIETAKQKQHYLEKILGEDIDTILADARYGFISGMVKDGVKEEKITKLSVSDKIDNVITNRFFGIPIFLIIMYLMFEITFTAARPLVGFMDELFSSFGEWIALLLTDINTPSWIISLINKGVITGIGSVLVFVPNIFLLFAFLSILEDTGYMARAAFLADKFMHKLGLHGKSMLPLIIGFGCNVPAIMATRTLGNEKDRLLTILMIPFMSCSARLPIYMLFVSAFFPAHQGLIIFSLYLFGIVVAITIGYIFKKILFKGLSAPLVMELPPYRIPTFWGTVLHVWQRGFLFIKKAGTIIFMAVVILWILNNITFGGEDDGKNSIIGIIGTFIAPIFKPLGFGDWQSVVALIFGFFGKEVVVGTLATLHSVNKEGLVAVLQTFFTPVAAYAFMVFSLLYVPCAAVIAIIKKETNSWKWAGFTVFYTIIVAWISSFLVYQLGIIIF